MTRWDRIVIEDIGEEDGNIDLLTLFVCSPCWMGWTTWDCGGVFWTGIFEYEEAGRSILWSAAFRVDAHLGAWRAPVMVDSGVVPLPPYVNAILCSMLAITRQADIICGGWQL